MFRCCLPWKSLSHNVSREGAWAALHFWFLQFRGEGIWHECLMMFQCLCFEHTTVFARMLALHLPRHSTLFPTASLDLTYVLRILIPHSSHCSTSLTPCQTVVGKPKLKPQILDPQMSAIQSPTPSGTGPMLACAACWSTRGRRGPFWRAAFKVYPNCPRMFFSNKVKNLRNKHHYYKGTNIVYRTPLDMVQDKR